MQKASSIELKESYILSLNIVNNNTFIVVQKKYILQFETNTWKRLWQRFLPFKEFDNEDLMVIGADKKLFLYDKKNNVIYETFNE